MSTPSTPIVHVSTVSSPSMSAIAAATKPPVVVTACGGRSADDDSDADVRNPIVYSRSEPAFHSISSTLRP